MQLLWTGIFTGFLSFLNYSLFNVAVSHTNQLQKQHILQYFKALNIFHKHPSETLVFSTNLKMHNQVAPSNIVSVISPEITEI